MLGWSQAPMLRNPSTTNQFMNLPSNGTVPVWNSVAGKWSNAPAGTAAAAGFSGAVQFNEGGAFDATNRFLYDRTNEVLSLIGGTAGSVRLYDNNSTHGVNLIGNPALSSNINLTFPHAMSNGLLSVVSVNDSNFILAVIPPSSGGTYLPAGISTEAFATALTNAPNGSTLVLGHGTFTVQPSNSLDGATFILLKNKTNLTIRGSGMRSTIISGTGPGTWIHMTDCDGVTFEDIGFDGDAAGHTVIGVNFSGVIWADGQCNNITMQRLRFTDIYFHCILNSAFAPNNYNNWSILQCEGKNYGVTNMPGIGPDGSLFAGCANNLRVLDSRIEEGMRGIEIFDSASDGINYTNIQVLGGIGYSTGIDAIFVAGDLQNVTISGFTIRGGVNVNPHFQSYAIRVGQGVNNISISGCDFQDMPAFILAIEVGTVGVTNLSFTGVSAVNCGHALYGGGISINDGAGGGVADSIYIRNNRFERVVNGYGVALLGGRNVWIENNAFIDIDEGGGRPCVQTFTGYDAVSNIVVRENRFLNTLANRATYAAHFHAEALDSRFENNYVTNMVSGAVNDLGIGTTIVGERKSYSVQTNLASLAAGASTTIYIPAPLARTNFFAEVMIPGNFFGVAGGVDIVTQTFCTNALICIRVVNNGAGAFDAPDTRIRAYTRAIESY